MSPLIKNILSPVHLKTYINEDKSVEYMVENSHQLVLSNSGKLKQQKQQQKGSGPLGFGVSDSF